MIKYNNKKNILVERCYTGDGVEEYLEQFKKEADFTARKNYSYYVNNIEGMIKSLVTPLYSQPINRGENTDSEFINSIDGVGTTMDLFMYEATISASLHGNAFVIVSADSEGFPKLTLKKMYELYAYSVDEDGRLNGIEFFNGYESDVIFNTMSSTNVENNTSVENSTTFSSDRADNIRIIGYTADSIYTYIVGEERKRVSVDNPIKKFPVVMFSNTINNFPQTYSMCKTNLAIYNQLSEQRDLERTQAFSILEIPMDVAPGDDVDLGSNNIIYIPTTSSRSSQYISPDSNILKTLRESAESTTMLLQAQADKLGVTSVSASKSGVAYSFEFLGKSYVLKSKGRVVASVERNIFYLASLYDPQIKEVEVIYPDDFIDPIESSIAKIEAIKAAKEIGIDFTDIELALVKEGLLKSL